MFQIECEICGDTVMAERKSRRYCDKCNRNSAQARVRMERNVYFSKRRLGELPSQQPIEITCKHCGKKIMTVLRGKSFCSKACAQEYRRKNATCPQCGVNLESIGITYRGGTPCCSDECREKRRWVIARANNNVKRCKHCGEEFITHGYKEYCSTSCEKAANPPPIKTPEPCIIEKKANCEICGAVFQQRPNGLHFTCSTECSKIRAKRKAEEVREKNRKGRETEKARRLYEASPEYRKQQIEAVLAGEITGKQAKDMHLCVQCKTSQRDCFMFESDFRYHPEGTVIRAIDGHNVVLACPQFR